jgi:hypothetical protein
MENRLEFFRQQMAAFDGAADPRGAIENGFYIEEPEHSTTNQLFKRICLKPDSRNLLLGGIGSGKTTQLLKIEQLLKDTDVYPHYVDVTRYALSEDTKKGVLDAVFGVELINLLSQKNIDLDEDIKRRVLEYAYGSVYTVDADQLTSMQRNIESLRYKHFSSGVFSHPPRAGEKSAIDLALKALIQQFRKHFLKTPFFLLDGLDRVDSAETFIKTFATGLSDGSVGFLLVGPVSLLYSRFADSIDTYFNYFGYRSAFDIHNDQSAYEFFGKILKSRTTEGIFHEAALKRLIYMSGGVLRDLISLAQESIQEAYLSDAEFVEEQHVKNAERSLGRAKILGLEKGESEILIKMRNTSLEAPTSPEEIGLLASGRILEYRYPNRCFSPHPVLRAILPYQVVAA